MHLRLGPPLKLCPAFPDSCYILCLFSFLVLSPGICVLFWLMRVILRNEHVRYFVWSSTFQMRLFLGLLFISSWTFQFIFLSCVTYANMSSLLHVLCTSAFCVIFYWSTIMCYDEESWEVCVRMNLITRLHYLVNTLPVVWVSSDSDGDIVYPIYVYIFFMIPTL